MPEEVETLLDEVRLVHHRVVQVAEGLHAGEPVTLGMRAILEFLERNGPATVPAIARRRFVTRQHVQALVNALLERRLAALGPNPAHRRSGLVTLTAEGARIIRRMKKREARFFARTDFGVGLTDLRQAARTLRRVRQALGGRP